MDRNALKNKLAEKFESRMTDFLKKRADYSAELEQELKQLSITYGDDVVSATVGSNGLPAPAILPQATTTSGKAASPTRKKRRRARRAGVLSFTELKPHVLAAVLTMGGKNFTTRDVRAELDKKGLKFDPGHITLIVTKYLTGISVVGKTKGRGTPMSIFAATGKVELQAYTKTVKPKKKK